MIGIHSPEYEFEKDRNRVMRFAQKFKVTHPVYIDNDLLYWDALKSENWPEFYLVDRQGNIRGKIVGEMHEGSRRAANFEALLLELLDQ